MARWPKSLISTFLFRHTILDNTPKKKKIEIDVKESFLIFKIMQWIFLTQFNIHIIDFLLLGFCPLQMRLCISLHENLLCDILTVTRNVNFTLPSYIEINSVSFLRNYYNSSGCEFFSPVTVTREVNFPLFLSILKYRLQENPVCAFDTMSQCLCAVLKVMDLCAGKKTPGFNRLYLPQYAECTKLASPYFVLCSTFSFKEVRSFSLGHLSMAIK